jgi:hypothetical protein
MLTLLEGAKLSRNPLTRGVLTAIATTDELLSQIAMVPKSGESFMYNREMALPTTPFYETAPVSDATLGTIGSPAAIAESGATFDQVIVPMRAIVGNVDVSNFAEEQQDDTNQQMATQLMKKLKALGRTIGQRLITGNYATTYALSATPTGTSIPATGAVGPGQDSRRHGPGSLIVDSVVAATSADFHYRAPGDARFGTAVSVTADGTYTLTSANGSKWIKLTVDVSALVSGSAIEAAVRVTPISAASPEWDGLQALTPSAQLVASTGTDGDDLTFEVLDRLIDEMVKVRERRFFLMSAKGKAEFYSLVRSLGGSGPEVTTLPGVNGPVPTYRGIPILQSDWIANTETKGANSDLTSVYLVSLDPTEGFYLGVGQKGQSVPSDIDPRSATIMGVRIRDIGQLETSDAQRMRVSFYGATALGSELAMSRASEIKTATSS